MKKLVDSLVLAVIVALPLAILLKMDELERKIEHDPVLYYRVDSEGAAWYGKVTRKEVTKEQYEALNIGDDAPEYVIERVKNDD